MKALRSILTVAAVAALVLCIAAGASAQDKKKKKGGKKFRGSFGTVVKCDLKDDGTGTITVRTRGNKKKKTKGKEVSYKITADTKVSKLERVKGKKKGKSTPARASDIKPRSRVIIVPSPDAEGTAARIVIFSGGRKKKKDAL